MDQELSRIKKQEIAIELAIEELSRGVHSNKGSMDRGSYRETIEHPKSFLIDRSGYQELSRMR